MSNKNPYEVRLEVLKMAQEMEQQHFYYNREAMMRNWEVRVEDARNRNEPVPPMPEFSQYPTEEKIVKSAQFLSEFVNNSGTKV